MATKLQESLIAINLREEIIKQQEDILVRFSHKHENCCVCIIDIVQSTVLTANLSNEQIQKFYGIFLNSVASIVKKFGGIVVKNVGDSLLFYFPNIESGDKSAFKNVIDCCLTICESNNEINMNMIQEKLPKIDFRISVTYGIVNTAKISTSSVDDIFGAIVNVCSKINRFALPNNVVIGSHVYENIQSLDNYNLSNMNVNPISSDLNYSVYLVTRNE
jgi:class 3 adenylate cyclase